MSYFVDIIYSASKDIYYKGYSLNPESRLQEHNADGSIYTRYKGICQLVYVEQFETKKQALIREKALKKYSHKQIVQIITSPKNKLHKG
jgi:putative endonuclease